MDLHVERYERLGDASSPKAPGGRRKPCRMLYGDSEVMTQSREQLGFKSGRNFVGSVEGGFRLQTGLDFRAWGQIVVMMHYTADTDPSTEQ